MRISDWSSDVCSSDLNAAVTADAGEIGRAQALQAMACRAEPHSDMNPVLLKPQADRTSQLIVHGRVRGTLGSGNFREARGALMTEVLESYHRLRGQCDIVIVEGDRKSTRRTPVTNAHLVCRLLLEKKKKR